MVLCIRSENELLMLLVEAITPLDFGIRRNIAVGDRLGEGESKREREGKNYGAVEGINDKNRSTTLTYVRCQLWRSPTTEEN